MEEKIITPQESLRVIQNMMEQTHINTIRRSGNPSLIWGYITTFVALSIYFILPYWGYKANYLWLLIPVIGGLARFFEESIAKKKHLPRTQMERMITIVWVVIGINITLMSFCYPLYSVILPLVLIFIGSATAITAFVARIKILEISSVFGIIVGYFLMFSHISGNLKILLFGITFFLMHCIPGHILSYKAKKEYHA